MIGQDELKQRLRELAEAAPQAASVESEQRLREIFRARQRRRRAWKYLTAVAASLVIGGASYVLWQGHERKMAATESSYVSPPGFLALPYAQSDVPLEHAVVVRVNMPPSEASALGVPFDPGARKRISADLLIGQDGMARAVRFVP
jgi:hypothetical protein